MESEITLYRGKGEYGTRLIRADHFPISDTKGQWLGLDPYQILLLPKHRCYCFPSVVVMSTLAGNKWRRIAILYSIHIQLYIEIV